MKITENGLANLTSLAAFSPPTEGILFFWILLLNDEPTNVLIRLFVTNNRLRIDYALKEHTHEREKNLSTMTNKRAVQLKI